jgi:hypothetical protein
VLILNRVLITMIKAPFGIVWTLVGAATPFSTWSLTRPHAWTRGASGFPCSRGTGKRGRRKPRPAPDPLPGPAHRQQEGSVRVLALLTATPSGVLAWYRYDCDVEGLCA